MVRRPCLDCSALAEPGKPRCATCHQARTRAISRARGTDSQPAATTPSGHATPRPPSPPTAQRHGDICPGWGRDPHPIDPKSWCCDHDLGALCRSCNARKAATADKQRARPRWGRR